MVFLPKMRLLLRFWLRLTFGAGDVPRRYGHGHAGMTVYTDAHLLMVTVVDRFHPATTDRTEFNDVARFRLGVEIIGGLHSGERHDVSTLLHQT